MNNYDLNTADKQSSFDLIPAKTIVKAIMTIRPGGQGDGGWLTDSKTSDAQMISGEFVVTEGEYAKRRWWQYMVISGGKQDAKGNSIAGNISRQTLRAILESARGINPDDITPEAMAKRQIKSWGDFNGIEFICRIGVEKDKTGQYDDKNKILEVITPDMKDYAPITQTMPQAAPQASASPAVNVPAWAQ